MMIRGEELGSLANYLEASDHLFELLKQTGFDLVSEGLRHECIKELANRG